MEGLLSLLLFAGVFYLMMRFGCGAHMSHGGHGHGGGSRTPAHTDPVCGREVALHEGYGKMFQGQLYHFCSRNCLDQFEDNPGQYVQLRPEHEGGAK